MAEASEKLRVLRLLSKEPAYELVSHPLRAPQFAIAAGWAEYGEEYDTWAGKERVKARAIFITEAGREALRSGRV